MFWNEWKINFPIYAIFSYWDTRETPAFGGISLTLWESGAFGGGKWRKKFGAPQAPQIYFPQGNEDSEYELSFEIG